MKAVVAALLFSMSLPVVALADSHGANQLREELMTQLPPIGVEINEDVLGMLSDQQVTEIAAIMAGNESDAEKARAVNAMLGN